MNHFLNRIELVFVALFGLAIIGIWAYQSMVIAPGQRCEAAGNWWDAKTRICGHVIYLPDITHRPPGARTPLYPDLPRSRDQAAEATSGPQPGARPRAR